MDFCHAHLNYPLTALPRPPVDEALRSLGQRIAQARQRPGWTQAQLAERIGVGLRTIRRMEAGAPGTAIGHIALALEAVGELASLDKLLGPDHAPTSEFATRSPVATGTVQDYPASVQPAPTPELDPAAKVQTTLEIGIGVQSPPVGRLNIVRQGERVRSTFRYDPAWLACQHAIEVSPGIPLRSGVRSLGRALTNASGLFPALADTAPGPWARQVIQRAHSFVKLTRPGITPLDERQYLYAVDDVSRLGALRLPQASLSWWTHKRQPAKDIYELVKAFQAFWAQEHGYFFEDNLITLMKHGCFLGGSRPKLNYLDDNGRLALVKLPRRGDPYSVPAAETLALRLARRAGMTTAQAKVIKINNIPIAVITRFDRSAKNKRLHYVSAATLLQVHEHDTRGYLELLEVMARVCNDFRRDAQELWRRLVFQALITHVDDHLRGVGFLYSLDNRGWRLAPAFGLNPTPVGPYRSRTPLSAALGLITSVEMLLAHAHHFALDRGRALNLLARMVGVIKAWREAGNLSPQDERLLQPAFEHERLEEARRLIA